MYLQRDELSEDLQKLVAELIEEIYENIEHDIEEVWAYNRLILYLMEREKVIDFLSES